MFGLMSPASQLEGRVMELDARLLALRDEVAKLSRRVQA